MRAYLHDGDHVVEEYASAPGQTGVLLARCHHWGRWIDDLVAEEIDTDGDGTLEITLYPVTDLLGSVELLTDEDGRIVERIAYDPDGTPRFWGEDAVRPRVTQLAWTGGGQSPAGVTVAASTLVLRFSEAIHDATMAGLTLTLTPDPGSRTQALDGDGRTLTVTFEQPIPATTPTALHLEGIKDRTGNTIHPFDTTFTLADTQAYAVLADTAAPRVEAVIDTHSGLVLTFDEPIQPPQGTPLAGAVTITRSGIPVSGTTTRLTETALAWTPSEPASWQPGGEYRVTALTLQDLHSQPNPIQAAPLPLTITHLATQPTDALLAYTAPTDSATLAASQYGQTALFQGREWHADLGMYYYRARWYAPRLGGFTRRDPERYLDSPGLYQALGYAPFSRTDPFGRDFSKDPELALILQKIQAAADRAAHNVGIRGWVDMLLAGEKGDAVHAELSRLLSDRRGPYYHPRILTEVDVDPSGVIVDYRWRGGRQYDHVIKDVVVLRPGATVAKRSTLARDVTALVLDLKVGKRGNQLHQAKTLARFGVNNVKLRPFGDVFQALLESRRNLELLKRRVQLARRFGGAARVLAFVGLAMTAEEALAAAERGDIDRAMLVFSGLDLLIDSATFLGGTTYDYAKEKADAIGVSREQRLRQIDEMRGLGGPDD